MLITAVTQIAFGISVGDGTKNAAVWADTPLALRTHVKNVVKHHSAFTISVDG